MREAAPGLPADLAVRPAYGLYEHEAAARLRHNARSAQPDVEFVLEMRVTYWDQGGCVGGNEERLLMRAGSAERLMRPQMSMTSRNGSGAWEWW
ncbi:hypothetical protein ACIPYS_21405 [Kitasatospora sp. NPDC089913]|uniref:hypothetical protein n=1 Tax=Streptomycetaceae TaxID=2062 RepID=UPI00087D8FDF|nr:hypothetical protein [Streptomyces sp. TLI_053]SDS58168.1 hypothetical protein SAMN05216371_0203 [Streptomyces sp. TLI_053]